MRKLTLTTLVLVLSLFTVSSADSRGSDWPDMPAHRSMSKAASAATVRGRIFDAVTGEPLAAANIQVEGTYRGTITNAQGEYALEVRLPATLIVRYIGYATASRPVTATDPLRQDFALRPIALEMENVVVTGENPAVEIMREVIKRKQQWRAELATFSAEAYNRFTMSNDTGIVSIMETLTRAYWDAEEGMREVVLGRRETANMNLPAALPAALLVANLYDDNIDVAGHTLRGVTHPSALSHYEFTLTGTRYRDDQIVYDIDVAPRNSLKSGFVGRISILDEEYAMIDVDLRPGESFLFPPPIQDLEISYRQQFDNFGGEFWFPVDFRSTSIIKVGFGAILGFPAIHLDQVSRLSGYEVNVDLPDSLFATRRSVTVDRASLEADTLMNRPGNAVPLTDPERMAFAAIDSSLTMDKAFVPTGLMARFARMNINISDSEQRRQRDSLEARRLNIKTNVEPSLWYNRVDQLHAGGALTLSIGNHIKVTGGAGYNTGQGTPDSARVGSNPRWSYLGSLRLEKGGRSSAWLDLGFRAGTSTRYSTNRYGLLVNSVYTLAGGRDYFDYYRAEGFYGRLGFAPRSVPARFVVGYNDEKHTMLTQSTSYDLAAARPMRLNPPVTEGRLRSVEARVLVGESTGQIQAVTSRGVVVEAEWSPPSLSGDFDFARYTVSADWAVSTLYRRRLLPNVLQVRAVAGVSSGSLPAQRRGIVDGSMSVYRPFGVLHTLEGPYEGDRHLGFFWEHNFRTIPFELIGWYAPARSGYSILVFGGHARTWLDGDPGPVQVAEQWHHEIGVSLSGIFGVLRLDLAARLDQPGFTVGAGFARLF